MEANGALSQKDAHTSTQSILCIFSELWFYLGLRPSFWNILSIDRPAFIYPNAYHMDTHLEGQRTFLVKVQIINTLDFVGHSIFLANYSALPLEHHGGQDNI